MNYLEEIFYKSGHIKSREWLTEPKDKNTKYIVSTYYEHGHVRKITHTDDDRKELHTFESFYENGPIERKEWRIDRKLNRVDGSAVEEYNESGTLKKREWHLNGLLDRIDLTSGPVVEEYYTSGSIKSKKWKIDNETYKTETFDESKPLIAKTVAWTNSFGKYYKNDGPAVIEYYDSGKLKVKKWYLDGWINRVDGPAIEEYYESGSIKKNIFYGRQDHKYCRCPLEFHTSVYKTDGPAVIEYYESGSIKLKEWYTVFNSHGSMNKLHRIDGPAYELFDENGNLISEKFYTNGELQIL